jgi:hypothetical protein
LPHEIGLKNEWILSQEDEESNPKKFDPIQEERERQERAGLNFYNHLTKPRKLYRFKFN